MPASAPLLLAVPLLLLLPPLLLLLPAFMSIEASVDVAGVEVSSPHAAMTAAPHAATKKIISFFIELLASTKR